MMKPTLMLIGLGHLGSIVLELLAREKNLGRIVVASRTEARARAHCNLARLGAMAQGYSPSLSFTPLDLDQAETVAETIHREKPDLIFSTATRQTWWLPDLLPPAPAALLKSAGFGVWLPIHLTLTLKLMQTLREAAYPGLILTAPFPDVINCVLGRLNLAPTCGVGNLDEIVPKVRLLAAQRLKTSAEAIQVLLVAHHALEPLVFRDESAEISAGQIPPYFLRVEHNGQDVTAAIQAEELLLTPYPLPPGPAINFLTAGSTIRLIRAFFSTDKTLLHVPGPYGLPGGYPVIVNGAQTSSGSINSQALQLAPIPGLTLTEAMAINERSHHFDGIERIEADGTVVFCAAAVETMRQTLGYDCERLSPDEAEERATELMARFREYATRHGVKLETVYQ